MIQEVNRTIAIYFQRKRQRQHNATGFILKNYSVANIIKNQKELHEHR